MLAAPAATPAAPKETAAVLCTFAQCDGNWPNAMGCISANTQQQVLLPHRIDIDEDPQDDPTPQEPIEISSNTMLFFSPECAASWVEVNIVRWEQDSGRAPFPQFWGQATYGSEARKAVGANPDAPSQQVEWVQIGSNSYRSPMWGWNHSVQMCMWWLDPDLYDPDPHEMTGPRSYEYDYEDYRNHCTQWL
ncbi:hypothetical protein [Plantactinospora sp. KLBMP9567]|uniref:hypothetical protein n=1 Tax=Plantactinospora sp. KLBMP9567 TaxID=3085900 RepID=UPI0029819621|nr:hypothetical protein [Plantactinospora sp. KLBMP9567]MDW5328523.1 hypothetical protein [Plantactinospora sp. KLBMP9567]